MSTFGNRLKRLRQEAGQTQADIGVLLGKTAATISKYEIGEKQPGIDEIISLVRYFDTTADYILGLSNKRYKELG